MTSTSFGGTKMAGFLAGNSKFEGPWAIRIAISCLSRFAYALAAILIDVRRNRMSDANHHV
jgi:hypothetical protein